MSEHAWCWAGCCDRADDADAIEKNRRGNAHAALAFRAERDAALEKVRVLEEALRACRSFLIDPEGTADVSISDTVWVRDGMTLLDLVEGALIRAALSPERMPSDG